MIIDSLRAIKIIDSRGNPTIEVEITTKNGSFSGFAPSGASTGGHEIIAFPEGVDESIKAVNRLGEKLINSDLDLFSLDEILKKEYTKTSIGGNGTVAVSMAFANAEANEECVPLYIYLNKKLRELKHSSEISIPMPLSNTIGGGKHAYNGTNIQEFLVVSKFDSKFKITDLIFANAAVHKAVFERLKSLNTAIGKGDEGAWNVGVSDEYAFETLYDACKEVEEKTGIKISMCLDFAASELWNKETKTYNYKKKGLTEEKKEEKKLTKEEQIEFVLEMIKKYNLFFVEDPLHEDDFEGFAELTRRSNCLICGDDLYVTDCERIKKGIEMKSTNTVLIKPNQCGTITETLKAISTAKNNGQKIVVSHRSGETCDNTIAHLACASGAIMIKTGIIGGERSSKLNELIRINNELENGK